MFLSSNFYLKWYLTRLLSITQGCAVTLTLVYTSEVKVADTSTGNPNLFQDHNISLVARIGIMPRTVVVHDPRVCYDCNPRSLSLRSSSQCIHRQNSCPGHNFSLVIRILMILHSIVYHNSGILPTSYLWGQGHSVHVAENCLSIVVHGPSSYLWGLGHNAYRSKKSGSFHYTCDNVISFLMIPEKVKHFVLFVQFKLLSSIWNLDICHMCIFVDDYPNMCRSCYQYSVILLY